MTGAASACPWVDDMLGMFGGLLFLGISSTALVPHAPCRRDQRHPVVSESSESPATVAAAGSRRARGTLRLL